MPGCRHWQLGFELDQTKVMKGSQAKLFVTNIRLSCIRRSSPPTAAVHCFPRWNCIHEVVTTKAAVILCAVNAQATPINMGVWSEHCLQACSGLEHFVTHRDIGGAALDQDLSSVFDLQFYQASDGLYCCADVGAPSGSPCDLVPLNPQEGRFVTLNALEHVSGVSRGVAPAEVKDRSDLVGQHSIFGQGVFDDSQSLADEINCRAVCFTSWARSGSQLLSVMRRFRRDLRRFRPGHNTVGS